ncbi:hypothetical protein DKX38_023288 [Salix brachista]|uniref:Uncharacterized protein n=1 Tax=Salix brachista TaxID=2182728 RepID=A0A5N5JIJ9_9ROSI|nr:hypothetical protein DKX38_023288 [Salix brachista]
MLSPLTEPPSPHNNSFCATTMADAHLTGVRIDSSSVLPPWIREMLEEYKESENNRTGEPNIPKVPEPNIPEVPGKLKEKKEECYRPLAVSIGPYHYSDRKEKLQEVEKLKVRMMVKFVEEDLYVNVKEELQKARGCYDENITEKFILDSLRKQRYKKLRYSNEIINNFLSLHIRSSGKPMKKWVPIALTALGSGNVSFHRWTAGAITDVKFKSSLLSGKVKAPLIIIDESTESLLLNLVAYESAAALDQLWVSSYILFMDSLIDDAEDVEEMRSNGIIINYLVADQKVANLFNDMGRSLTHDTYDTAAYNDVKMAINKQCESTVKRWVYEWKKTYFSNPWTFITVLAASFGLCLTATQTYYTRYPPK